ncbi:hypothetical protein Tco_0487899 [Tanacetum coccineum]
MYAMISVDVAKGQRARYSLRAPTVGFLNIDNPSNFKGNALMWWNSHIKTVSHEVAYGMPWKTLKMMMTDKYCQRGEIKKLEIELMFPKESDEVEKKLDNDKQAQQQPPKKPNVARAYSAGSSEKKEYAGTLPSCKTNNQRTLTYYGCGNQWHYRSDCPELKNRNHGHQAIGAKARGMVYALGGGETNQDLDNTEDDINAQTLFL